MPPTRVLGISAYYHDSAACLVEDGRIVAAAQEERFTRIKHDASFPAQAVRYCLDSAGIRPSDLTLVGFYEKPLVKFSRLLETYLTCAPRGLSSYLRALPVWLGEKLWMRDGIRSELDGYGGEVLFGEHHESHAASAFYPSPFEEAAILTVDGVGEWATSSIGVGRGQEIELLHEMRFPHSLGLLYSAFTSFTGFKVNAGEYKLMGLAPYGEPRYVGLMKEHLIEIREDGAVWLNMDYFSYPHALKMTGRKFARLFGGAPRTPEGPLTQRELDLARSVQVITEEVMLKMARRAHQETGMRDLCLAGGVALNCVANGRLIRETPFEEVWIQPAAGDAGGALGVALAVWHRFLGKPRHSAERSGQWRRRTETADAAYADGMSGSYLGPAFTGDEIERFLRQQGCRARRFDEGAIASEVAGLIADGKVVGLFQGRMEFGPRALGNRSIVGDARSPAMQSVMNLKIKFRESFRPFAPSVLYEHAADWFELDRDSPYMLLVADVQPERRVPLPSGAPTGLDALNIVRSQIPAVTHVDYSARVQTVRREMNPRYYAIIDAFHRRTGCPVIVNTSFNVRGEPLVCTPADAYRCFMRTNIDALVLEDFILDKRDQPAVPAEDTWQQEFVLD
jgi:carbamoyltransferase